MALDRAIRHGGSTENVHDEREILSFLCGWFSGILNGINLELEGSDEAGRIIVLTGAPRTGKTTTSAIMARGSDMERSVHMHTDDLYHYLSKGAIPPHLLENTFLVCFWICVMVSGKDRGLYGP